MAFISENFNTADESAERHDAISAFTKLLHGLKSMHKTTSTLAGLTGGIARNLTEEVQRYEVTLICEALLESRGNQTKAAKRLGMKKTTLHAKIRRYEIDSLDLFSESGD